MDVEKAMKKSILIAMFSMLVPIVASAQYKDLDAATTGVNRGFERGETQPIIAGIGEGDQVMLHFPGLIDAAPDFFGRDQASYLLDELFNKTKPTRFQQSRLRKVSSEGQYYLTAVWTIQPGGKSEDREVYVTLRSKGDRWSIVSIKSASR